MMSLEALKANSNSLLASLQKKIAEQAKSRVNEESDDRFWRPTLDKAGNSLAIIRFLPSPNPDEDPFVRYYDHAFQGPSGLWYIEKSRTSLSTTTHFEPDPVQELVSILWKLSGSDENSLARKLARTYGRRVRYVSNIYIVNDYVAPENNGRVALFVYGPKIFSKIRSAIVPEFPDEKPMNPFDLWRGANFKLKIHKVQNYNNYDKSEFESPAPLFSSDDQIRSVWERAMPLSDFVDPSNYKSYEELRAKLYRVLEFDANYDLKTNARVLAGLSARPEDVLDRDSRQTTIRATTTTSTTTSEKPSAPLSDDDDELENIDFFRNLAAGKIGSKR